MRTAYYLCIDLKSFYASVECVERGLNPMNTNLIVADPDRTDKTICLAITPAMKALGVKNRCRVFEIPKGIDYIMAVPCMQKYIDYSAQIYGIYLKYISKEDIHVYSIDEVFIDVTKYLELYHIDVRRLAKTIILDIYNTLGIPASCGIGTNLYLAKVALDILAKHAPDSIAYLDEKLYCERLWNHRPLTDFWRFGKGICNMLAKYGINTMGELAETDEDFLYRIFGIDAELIIDHAYGRETVTIADIKAYKSKMNSISNGQVLPRDYSFEEGKLIVKEMMDVLCLDMAEKNLVTKSVTLDVGYTRSLGVSSAHGTVALDAMVNAPSIIIPQVVELYGKIVNFKYNVRKITITCNNVIEEKYRQYNLFIKDDLIERDRRVQDAIIKIKKQYGKNAILRGMNFDKAATTRERNMQIGGHRSGEKTQE